MLVEEVDENARKRLGTVLRGKYRLDGILGIGGMAVVYAATHRNQKRFAVKALHPELSIRKELRERFLREGYLANTVGHPGAVSVLDDDMTEDGAAFLVMELLEGRTVEQLWEQGGRRLPAQPVLALVEQLLDVLSAAHAKSIVHRDVKPANLFVTTEGALKVLDFGIARVRDATSGGSTTRTGTMLGTPAYMAPEQAGGRSSEVDGQTDLWAVGACMFTLLSGEPTHEGETPQHVVVLRATQPAQSLASVAPDADPRIVLLVDRALAFEKASRWPGAETMRDAVRTLYSTLFGEPVDRAPLAELVASSIATSVRLSAEKTTMEAAPRQVDHFTTMNAATIPSDPGSHRSAPSDGGLSEPTKAMSPYNVTIDGTSAALPGGQDRVDSVADAARPQRVGRVPLTVAAVVGTAVGVAAIVVFTQKPTEPMPAGGASTQTVQGAPEAQATYASASAAESAPPPSRVASAAPAACVSVPVASAGPTTAGTPTAPPQRGQNRKSDAGKGKVGDPNDWESP